MENELTLEVIGELTEADLKELGLPMGVRKLFLKRVREGANEVNSPSSDHTLSTPSTEAITRSMGVVIKPRINSALAPT